MDETEFLGRFEGVSPARGGGWTALCPAHGDRNASLSIARGADGRWLVHCHAGCAAADVAAAAGLRMRDLMPDGGAGRSGRPGRGDRGAAGRTAPAPRPRPAAPKARERTRTVCEYVYEDEGGTPRIKVVRLAGEESGRKSFRQYRADASATGGWSSGLADPATGENVPRWPFRLPQVAAAAAAGRRIVVVEGEKDVLTAESMGLAATCNSGGAGKWADGWPADWARWFEGAPGVVVVADNDPATKADPRTGAERPHLKGQRHAWDVLRKLRAAGYRGEVRLAVMPQVEGAARVKDLTDWAEARRAAGLPADRAAFAEAVRSAPPWPAEWEFGDADGGGESASAAPSPAPPPSAFRPLGRFGAKSPTPAPGGGAAWAADFQADGTRTARFEVGAASLRFEGWQRDDGGRFVRTQSWRPMEGDLRQFAGMAMGCLLSWIPEFRGNAAARTALVPSLAVAWLRARGRFFADADNPGFETSMWFDGRSGVLYRIHSDEFRAFLSTATGVNREDKAFRFVASLVDDLALDASETPRVVPARQWTRGADGAIYISCGDSEMYRVSAGRVERVANGTDGVVFVRGSTLAPWRLLPGPGADPFSESLIFRCASLATEEDRMNCRLWFLNIFACHANKPILLATGPARSGKTRLLQGMKQFLGLRDDGKPDDSVVDVDPTDKGLDAFWVLVDRERLAVFDNLDSKVKWAENAFQTASTNGSCKRRQLYTSGDMRTFRANAYIAVTSNNPVFTTGGGGLPDRIVTVRVAPGRRVSLGSELLEDVLARRDEYMTWTARTLAAALADREPVDRTVNGRHPDYGRFSVRCARAFGDEAGALRAMDAAEIDKAVLPLVNDAVARQVCAALLDSPEPGAATFTSAEMSATILRRLGEDDADRGNDEIYGPRRVGKAIKRLKMEFGYLFRWKSGVYEGRTRYVFSGLTAQGAAGIGQLRGGLVGLLRESPLADADTGGVSPAEPTDATERARAPLPAPLPSPLGDKEGEEGGGGMEWDL